MTCFDSAEVVIVNNAKPGMILEVSFITKITKRSMS